MLSVLPYHSLSWYLSLSWPVLLYVLPYHCLSCYLSYPIMACPARGDLQQVLSRNFGSLQVDWHCTAQVTVVLQCEGTSVPHWSGRTLLHCTFTTVQVQMDCNVQVQLYYNIKVKLYHNAQLNSWTVTLQHCTGLVLSTDCCIVCP